jgi:hypothetical protein
MEVHPFGNLTQKKLAKGLGMWPTLSIDPAPYASTCLAGALVGFQVQEVLATD